MSSAPVVRVEGVSKWFGGVVAVSDVSFTIPPGVTALLGPNGAGKSTMLRMLCGLARPSKGTVRVLGRDPRTDVGVTSLIGLAPQQESVFEPLTAHAFVRATGVLHGVPDPGRAAADALRAVELDPTDTRRLPTYSKGMRQRVKLAQALAHGPEMLILDEPLSGADPAARVHILRTIADFAKQGGHVLMSTHVLYEIERITNNIVLIHNGKSIASGDIHAIRALIDEHPHAVRLVTPQPREVAKALAGLDHVVSIEIPTADALLVRTRKPDAFYTELPQIVVARGLSVVGLESPDDSLEAVFRYLVG